MNFLSVPILFVLAFIVSTRLDGWSQTRAEHGQRSGNMMAVLMGDSRRLFANQFFVKADVYFHSGNYPSIFGNQPASETPHIATYSGAEDEHDEHEECSVLGQPLDWIDRFGRRFYASEHTHLDEGGPRGLKADKTEQGALAGLEREMLPWLRMSVAMDPQHVESYVVAAYWLRERLDATDEAEKFLREGLRANPNSHELLFELGMIALESRDDNHRAQTLWRAGIAKWHEVEDSKSEPDYFGLRKLLAYLALAEERNGQYREAIAHLQEADALPGGKGLYTVRMQRAQDLLEGRQPALSETDVAEKHDEHQCHDPNCHLDHD